MSSRKQNNSSSNFTFVDIKLDKSEVEEAIALSSDVHQVMTAFDDYIDNGWVISFKPGKRKGSVAAYLTCMDKKDRDYMCSIGCFTPHIRETWALLWVKLEKAQAIGGLKKYHEMIANGAEQLYG